MPKDENVKAIALAAAQFSAKDLEGYLELYDKGVLHHGFGNVQRGVKGLREHFEQLLRGFPDLRIDSQDIFDEGERVAHCFTFYGTHRRMHGLCRHKEIRDCPRGSASSFRARKVR
jgi:SnoaL-like polyketide cyclase